MCGEERSSRNLRITILGLNYAPETTGIAPYTTGLARHLAAHGHDVTVIAGHPHYPQWKLHAGYERPRSPEVDWDVRLVRVRHPVPRNPTGVLRVWMESVFAVRSGIRLLTERPDVVVVISPALLAVVPAILLRRLRGYRLGVIVQDLYGAALSETGIGGKRLSGVAGRFEQSMLRRASSIVVIHDVFRRALIGVGLPPEKIHVIPNWTHVTVPGKPDRAVIRERLGWRDDEFIALHAGNMGAKQGLEGLIDVGRLAEQRNSIVRVVIMGNGSRRVALEAYARDLERVSIVDSLPEGEFEMALAAADCLLLHEKRGVIEMSVPSKLTSYFAAGRPVVAATDSRSGAASLIRQAEAGVIVESGDAASLLEAIEEVAAKPREALAAGQRAREFAAAHLNGLISLSRKEDWVRRLAEGRE